MASTNRVIIGSVDGFFDAKSLPEPMLAHNSQLNTFIDK